MQPKLLILPGMEELGGKILQKLNNQFSDMAAKMERIDFRDGTSKVQILTRIRSSKLFILCDPYNYSITYTMRGKTYEMSPDMHMLQLLRVISAVEDDAEISLIMPCLYGARQHERKKREDLITAIILRILESYVKRVITYDVHSNSFDCTMTKKALYLFSTTALLLEAFQANNPGLEPREMFALGTDEGALKRARKMAKLIGKGCIFATCAKLRSDENQGDAGYEVERHELFGRPELLRGKHIIITDDILDSGTSLIDVLEMLKDKGCLSVDITISFGLFTKGLTELSKVKAEGLFRFLYVTNLVYIPPEIRDVDWIKVVDAAPLLAETISTIISDGSLDRFF